VQARGSCRGPAIYRDRCSCCHAQCSCTLGTSQDNCVVLGIATKIAGGS
jgi:hypothetical protein